MGCVGRCGYWCAGALPTGGTNGGGGGAMRSSAWSLAPDCTRRTYHINVFQQVTENIVFRPDADGGRKDDLATAATFVNTYYRQTGCANIISCQESRGRTFAGSGGLVFDFWWRANRSGIEFHIGIGDRLVAILVVVSDPSHAIGQTLFVADLGNDVQKIIDVFRPFPRKVRDAAGSAGRAAWRTLFLA